MKLEDNPIIRSALIQKPIDTDLYEWLKADILKYNYILRSLESGATVEEVCKTYGVDEMGVRKYFKEVLDSFWGEI